MSGSLERALEAKLVRLHRHFLALSPSSPSQIPTSAFPTARELALPAAQDLLAQRLLTSDEGLDGSFASEGGQAWRKVFWRRVVKAIEAGYELRREAGEDLTDEEVNADILEAVVDLLPFEPRGVPPPSTRTYAWGPLLCSSREWSHVSTREDGRMIVGGTTGLRTWQASVALGNHLIAKPELLRARRERGRQVPIVELGAGAGLLSLVVARLGEGEGREVVASDVDEGVLANLTANVRLNSLDHRIKAKMLDWAWATEADGQAELTKWESDVFGPGGRADLILGADILYDPDLSPILAATLAFLLRPTEDDSPPPEAIVAGTIRQESTWHTFISEFEKSGLRVEQVELESSAEEGIVGAEGWEGEGEVKLIKLSTSK